MWPTGLGVFTLLSYSVFSKTKIKYDIYRDRKKV